MKKQHPNANWFGMSAIVCEKHRFMPVQRIANKCALNVKLDGYEDSVFVACPIRSR